MDNLTHTAVGLFLSRAGLNRWTPHATAILVIAANIPDMDVVTAAGGSLSYLHYHRHLTHSLLAMPLMALLSVALVRAISRAPVRWLGAFAAALIGVASHLLLDLTNTYGVRLLLPFSSQWFRFDIASFPDPWAWSILMLGILGPLLSRLVGSEISSGSARIRHYGQGGAIFALLFLTLYDSGRAVLHARAVNILESRLYQGISSTISTLPAPSFSISPIAAPPSTPPEPPRYSRSFCASPSSPSGASGRIRRSRTPNASTPSTSVSVSPPPPLSMPGPWWTPTAKSSNPPSTSVEL